MEYGSYLLFHARLKYFQALLWFNTVLYIVYAKWCWLLFDSDVCAITSQGDNRQKIMSFMLMLSQHAALAVPVLASHCTEHSLALNTLIATPFSSTLLNCSLSVVTDILTYCKFYSDLLGSSWGPLYPITVRSHGLHSWIFHMPN